MNFEDLKDIIPLATAKKISDFDLQLDFSPAKSGPNFHVDYRKKLVTIFVKRLSVKEDRKLKKVVKDNFNKDGEIEYLVEGDKIPLLERLYKYNDSADNQILSFFTPVLSKLDWLALRDSLFLRNEFKLGRNIRALKMDIILRYGERGKTICNLASAGYFEETMIPLFNSSEVEFWSYWDVAVNRGIAAFFVNAGMSIDKIRAEIKRILISAKSYGLPYVHIHGIGKTNTQNITKCVEQEKGTSDFTFTEKKIFYDKKLEVLVVEIIL